MAELISLEFALHYVDNKWSDDAGGDHICTVNEASTNELVVAVVFGVCIV